MLTEQQLIQVIAQALEIDTKKININTNADEIDLWDSLGHLNILINLDKATEGKASTIRELGLAVSVNAIKKALSENGLISE